jgi:hypothetical protein
MSAICGVAAIVEPGLKPYQPTHRIRTEHGERHVVTGDGHRASLIVVLAEARSEEQGPRQRRHRAGEVDDRRAGEVLHSELGQPAAAPDPVPHQRVDDASEDYREYHVHRELGPLEHRAPDDRQGHSAERHLEEELGRERDLGPREPGVDVVDRACRRVEEPALRPHDGVAGAEGDREPHGPEQERCDREVHEYLRYHAPDVLHPREADLQHREPRLHEQDQDRRYEDPHGVHR